MAVCSLTSVVIANCMLLAGQVEAGVASVPGDRLPEFRNKRFTFSEVKGIGRQEGVTRRDPSDVIKVGDAWYVWYTRVDQDRLPARDRRLRASGYVGTVWAAVSRDEGHTWTEIGKSLGKGRAGAFDSHAVFTPNILKADGKYYLFYTGVKPTPGRSDGGFENNSTTDFTAIGLAVADSPEGPFKRVSEEPVLRPGERSADPKAAPSKFDSYRIDDSALLVRDGKYWLYYKGRDYDDGRKGPAKTRMGVAVAEHVEGPYVKQRNGDAILDASHEVLIWPHREGVAAYASKSRTLEYAPDGLDFMSNPLRLKALPRPIAPGAFRPDLTEPVRYGRGVRWGISMRDPAGPCPYLVRWEIDLVFPEAKTE